MKTGGQLIVEALEANGVERIFCVPGESYLAVLDALHDSPIRTIVCRQEGGAAMMADCHGTADRQARHLLRHPRPRRHQCIGRHPYRHAGFDPADPVHRPDRARHAQSARRSRRSTTGASSATSPNGWSRSTTPPASPNSSPAPSRWRRPGGPGRSSSALPEDVLTEDSRGAARPAPHTPVETAPGEAELERWQSCSAQAKRPFAILGGTAGVPRPWLPCEQSAEAWSLAGRLLVPPADAVRPPASRTMPAMSASASTRIGAPRSSEADLVLLIGGRMGEMPSSDYTLLKSPYPGPDAGPCPRRRRRARPRLPADAGDQRLARRPSSKPSPSASRPACRPGRRDAESCMRAYLDWSTPPESGPGPVPDGADHELPGKGAARRRHPHQRRRQLRHLGASLPPLPPLRHASCADLGLDGLRHAGSGRRQGAVSRTARWSPSPATAAS